MPNLASLIGSLFLLSMALGSPVKADFPPCSELCKGPGPFEDTPLPACNLACTLSSADTVSTCAAAGYACNACGEDPTCGSNGGDDSDGDGGDDGDSGGYPPCPEALPGPKEAIVYSSPAFCKKLPIGTYPNSSSFAPLANDSISGVKVGSDASIKLFRHAWFETKTMDDYAILWESTWSLPSTIDHATSSIVVEPKGDSQCHRSEYRPQTGQVTLYTRAGFTFSFSSGDQCITKNVGSYPTTAEVGMQNDSLSAIKIGPGTGVTVCRDANFGGVCETFTSDVADMSFTKVGNNKATSYRVFQF